MERVDVVKILIVQKEKIAGFVADIVERQIERNPNSVLGMTTGSTPLQLGIYQEWIERSKKRQIDFSRAKFVNPDELLGLPADHDETYRMYMKKHLFSGLGVSGEKTFIPNSGTMDAEEECRNFEKLLKDLGGIDLQLMGLGLNGHIAFIEPADAIPSSTYVVKLDEENRPKFSGLNSEKDPTHAITVGLRSVLRAESIVLVATGEKKADIIAQSFLGPVTTKVPASFLQLHMNATIILDEASASRIPEHFYESSNEV